MALAGVTCSTCHNNAGAGTAGHSSSLAAGATISLPNGLKAKTITMGFGYDTVSGKCSGIICHGGQTTPSWSTGAIVVNTDCRSCHELGTAFQTPQYNSYYSGKFIYPGSSTTTVLHQLHLSSNDPTSVSLVKPLISCTSCHNTVKLSPRHFSGLTTPAFDEPPGNIPGGGSTNITLYTPYTTAVPSGSCVNRCHAVRYWQN
jgi:predicted CxxxxCH...CXXCH cytochrome family protein